MLISLITAWLAVLFSLLAAAKFLARKSGRSGCNRFFRRIHLPLGAAALGFGLLHGLFAGNRFGMPIGEARVAPVLFTPNAGTICFLLLLALAATYLLRRTLKKHWMTAHRVLTVLLLTALAVHLVQVGISLPNRLLHPAAASSPSAVDPTDAAVSSAVDEFSGAVLQDGTYTGEGEGFGGTITVSVTVADGKVTAINVVSDSETPSFFERALPLLDEIIDCQSLEVDAVSSATYSSAGLIDAVRNALTNAVTSGELQAPEIDRSTLPQSHGHGGMGQGGGQGLHKGPSDGRGPGRFDGSGEHSAEVPAESPAA